MIFLHFLRSIRDFVHVSGACGFQHAGPGCGGGWRRVRSATPQEIKRGGCKL